jgi:hypothetical protein
MRSGFLLAFAGSVLLVLGHPAMAQNSVMADETPAGSEKAVPGQGELPIVEENGLVGLITPRKEPDFFVVEGVAYNDLLNVREKASAGGRVLGRLPNGVALRNLGCGEFNGARWCRVETLDEPKIAGWAGARYMQESYVDNALVELQAEARIETPSDWDGAPPAVPGVAPAGDAAPTEAAPVERSAEPAAEARIEMPAGLHGEPPTVPAVPPTGGGAASASTAMPVEQTAEPPAIGGSIKAEAELPAESMASLPSGGGLAPAGGGAVSANAALPVEQSAEPPAIGGTATAEAAPPAERMASLPAGGGLAPAAGDAVTAEAALPVGSTVESPAAGERRPANMTPLARTIAGWLVSRGMRIEGVQPPRKVADLPVNGGVQVGTAPPAEATADVTVGENAPAGVELPVGQNVEPPAVVGSAPVNVASLAERIADVPAGKSAPAGVGLPVGDSVEPPATNGSALADPAPPTERIAGLPAGESATAKPTPGFDATGQIPCARYYGQPMTQCVARVKRVGDGSAMVTVAWPDGGQRVILFIDGRADNSDSPETLTYTREADLNMIRVGKAERFEIPDALPFGG